MYTRCRAYRSRNAVWCPNIWRYKSTLFQLKEKKAEETCPLLPPGLQRADPRAPPGDRDDQSGASAPPQAPPQRGGGALTGQRAGGTSIPASPGLEVTGPLEPGHTCSASHEMSLTKRKGKDETVRSAEQGAPLSGKGWVPRSSCQGAGPEATGPTPQSVLEAGTWVDGLGELAGLPGHCLLSSMAKQTLAA